MPVKDQAAYMREYRAKRKAEHEIHDANKGEIGRLKTEAGIRIRELEAEVARLKRELAARPVDGDLERAVHRARTVDSAVDMSFRQFRPAPKTSRK